MKENEQLVPGTTNLAPRHIAGCCQFNDSCVSRTVATVLQTP